MQSSAFNTPRAVRRLMKRAGAIVISWIHLSYQQNSLPITAIPWVFLFSVNMKDLVPTVTSNNAAAGPIPGHSVSLGPSPPHIKPPLTKAAVGGIMRRTPFNYLWSVTFSSCVVCWHCLPVWRVDRAVHTVFLLLDTSHWGQHQSFASSLGQQSGFCTHNTDTKGEESVALPTLASSRRTTVSCLSRKPKSHSKMQHSPTNSLYRFMSADRILHFFIFVLLDGKITHHILWNTQKLTLLSERKVAGWRVKGFDWTSYAHDCEAEEPKAP